MNQDGIGRFAKRFMFIARFHQRKGLLLIISPDHQDMELSYGGPKNHLDMCPFYEGTNTILGHNV